MIRKMILFGAITLMISTLALAQSKKEAGAIKKTSDVRRAEEKKGNVTVQILSVTKNDAQAKKLAEAKSRSVPVTFTWLCGSEGAAKLAELTAELVTRNTDGSTTRVSKRLSDWTVNKPINSLIELPMPEGVFASSFTLTLKGKFKKGLAEDLAEVSAVKSGNFPAPSKIISEKK
jgi:hypothetical protein